MQKIKITAIRKADYKDLQQKYENPIQHACDIRKDRCLLQTDGRDRKGCVNLHGKVFLLL